MYGSGMVTVTTGSFVVAANSPDWQVGNAIREETEVPVTGGVFVTCGEKRDGWLPMSIT